MLQHCSNAAIFSIQRQVSCCCILNNHPVVKGEHVNSAVSTLQNKVKPVFIISSKD